MHRRIVALGPHERGVLRRQALVGITGHARSSPRDRTANAVPIRASGARSTPRQLPGENPVLLRIRASLGVRTGFESCSRDASLRRGCTAQQPLRAEILIELGPMDAEAATRELPVLALLGS